MFRTLQHWRVLVVVSYNRESTDSEKSNKMLCVRGRDREREKTQGICGI